MAKRPVKRKSTGKPAMRSKSKAQNLAALRQYFIEYYLKHGATPHVAGLNADMRINDMLRAQSPDSGTRFRGRVDIMRNLAYDAIADAHKSGRKLSEQPSYFSTRIFTRRNKK
ncbi:MAG TPA: hypothetical protein VJH23_06055 [archaeon]|nr:hypothetical protein [archaeon]